MEGRPSPWPRFDDPRFGAAVRHRRTRLHLPRRTVAAALGVSAQYLTDVEEGVLAPATPAWAARLTRVLAP